MATVNNVDVENIDIQVTHGSTGHYVTYKGNKYNIVGELEYYEYNPNKRITRRTIETFSAVGIVERYDFEIRYFYHPFEITTIEVKKK